MRVTREKLLTAALGAVWAVLIAGSASAEDAEIYTGIANSASAGRPNILLLLDDSGSMGAQLLTQNDYDPAVVYAGGNCNADPNLVYWNYGSFIPACDTGNYFNASALVCQRAVDALAANQGGSYQDYFARYNSDAGVERWEFLEVGSTSDPIECQDDLPDAAVSWPGHGNGLNASDVYPLDGDAGNLWTDDENDPNRVNWGAFPTEETYTVFSGNYLNWAYGEAGLSTRLQVMQDVASNLVNTMNGVNIGIMDFSSGQGGIVSHAAAEVELNRTSLINTINGLYADGTTPLSETLYEAYLYMTGGLVHFGTGSDPNALITGSSPERYDSPIEQTCQRNHIVLLTDGEPIEDYDADSMILSLTDAEGQSFNSLVGGSCDIETYPPGFGASGGECLDELAEFMNIADLATLPGQQNITTHTVGFLVDLPILAETAARGGGEYQTATDTATLTNALSDIVLSILDTQSTFTAPAVSVNAFSQTRHTDEIYVSLFQPSLTAHWPGNLKKFRLRASDATIVDANDQPIVDPVTGTFANYVQDLWSINQDGADVEAGGAANELPVSRTVFTYLGDSDLTSASNAITTANLSDAMLGTGAPGQPSAQEVIDFINGIDVGDADQDGDITEPRLQMGDPLHSAPQVVVYGPDNDDALVFLGTNDGMLHAFNVDDGSEEWAFLPPEFLTQQVSLLVDDPTSDKTYGVDGTIRVQIIADGNGVIEEADGEQVILIFGMRRGGDAYYALDVTDPDSPELLWQRDSGDLPGAGQSWSGVTPTRINVAGVSQNTHDLALVIGGGYDASQDGAMTSADASGNSIYILDTLTGNLLWHGSASGANQNFSNSNWSMDYSIPADVRAIDLNSDGYADRLYAADMGGQVWRFDVTNGNAASSLVAGGVIAQLGAAGQGSPDIADTRRFYYAPDIALVTRPDASFVHIGIGSGHRAHPNSTVNHDEIYALRDYATFGALTQSQYNSRSPIGPADLIDVTNDIDPTIPVGSAGWRLSLNDGGWQGEKVLAEARTFNGQVFFSTYRPNMDPTGCAPGLGITRQYILDLFDASPVTNLDGSVDDVNFEITDRYREFEGPPPPETVFLFPPAPPTDYDGDGIIDEELNLACVAGGDCLGEISCQGLICTENEEPRFPVRTFWNQAEVD